MKLKVLCQDKYEAQKFSALIYVQDNKETFIKEIVNAFGNELVISLKDKSVHSVLLKNSAQVENLADFLQSVFEGTHKITRILVSQEEIEISKG